LHGSAFEFLRNDVFDARDPFALPDEGKELDRHQFGGTFGGPIRRNRAFFFASLETTNETRGVNFRTDVPTAAIRSGDFSGYRSIFDPATTRPSPNGTGVVRDPFPGNRIPIERLNPLASQLADMYPMPNLGGVTDNYSVIRDFESLRHQIDTRFDQSFTTSSKAYVRYSLTRLTWDNPGPFDPPLIGTTFFQQSHKDQWAHNLAIGQTQVFGGSKVNEIRIGYNRIKDDLHPFVTDTTPAGFGFKGVPEVEGVTGLPRLTIGGFANIGEAAFLPNGKISEVVQLGDTFSWLRGRHALKLGGNYRFIRSFFNISGDSRSVFNFGGGFTRDPQSRQVTGSGLADFLLGMPTTASVSTVLAGDLRYHYLAGFVQDDWRINDRLTVNMGARYELFTHPYERRGNQANMLITPDGPRLAFVGNNVPASIPREFTVDVPSGVSSTTLMRSDRNNVGPRLGFAYKIAEPTVVRGGIGRFFGDHPVIGASGRLPSNPPFRVDRNYSNDLDLARPEFFTLDEGFPVDALDPTFSSTLGFAAWNPEAPQAEAYHWNTNVQHELPWVVVELGYTGSRGENLSVSADPNTPVPGPGSVASRRPYPTFGGMSGVKYESRSDYHAGHIRVERRFRQGLSVIGHYTYGKSTDTGGQQFIAGDAVYRNNRNVEWEHGLSTFDVRHNLVVSYIWDIPIGKGRRLDLGNGWLNATLGGWQFNGISTARTGRPFTPAISFNEARVGHSRPDRIADGNLPRGERTIERWYDTSAFVAPAPGS
ncbi:MAG: TonB-dependent receptor domain-containing protein, partial [Vicinamibacterales bacterium]